MVKNHKLQKKLVMTLLARNEEDIIEECIKFHLSQGVDFIIATDNGSTDNTRNIFLKYQNKGVLHLIDEPEHNYNQDKWVHNMIILAKKKYKADWVMNVDADEFWFSNHGNIKLSLPDPKVHNVLFVGAIQVDPVESIENGLFKIPNSVSGIVSGIFKCMHTTKGYKKNIMGNHEVKMQPFCRRATTTLDLIIFHFSVRSYEHYERKIINGTKALDSNPRFSNNRAGSHIRELYKIYQEGKLKEEYEKMKVQYKDSIIYINSDSRLFDYTKNNYKSIEQIMLTSHEMYNGKNIIKPKKEYFLRLKKKINKKLSILKGDNINKL